MYDIYIANKDYLNECYLCFSDSEDEYFYLKTEYLSVPAWYIQKRKISSTYFKRAIISGRGTSRHKKPVFLLRVDTHEDLIKYFVKVKEEGKYNA